VKYFPVFIGILFLASVAFASVELSSFQATPGSSSILLEWTTSTETNNDHFQVVRDGSLVGQVPGAGNSSSPHSYSWTDSDVMRNHHYSYELRAVDASGTVQSLDTLNSFAGTLGLAMFSVTWYGSAVAITWSTLGEIDNDHFTVVRDNSVVVGTAAAHNGSDHRAYARFDSTAVPGTSYTYCLWVITLAGDSVELDSAFLSSEAVSPRRAPNPESFTLAAFPNPFNPVTSLTFVVPRASDSRLTIFDLSGREVETVFSGWIAAAEHRVSFDGSRLPSGTYVAALRAGRYIASEKLILLK